MEFPKSLKNFNLFVSGQGFAGKITELALPKLAIKTEEHLGAGMDAPIELDMGMEKLECSFTLAEYNKDSLTTFGLGHNKPVDLQAKGALSDGQAGAVPVVAILKGMVKEQDPGSWKSQEKTEAKFTVNLQYYKLTVDGADIFEIDILNMIRKINGVDQLAAVRGAIGV